MSSYNKVELCSNNQVQHNNNNNINNNHNNNNVAPSMNVGGPVRQQMFQTADLNPMFHQRHDVQIEESWNAEPEGSSCYEFAKWCCVGTKDERPSNCCNCLSFRKASQFPIQKTSNKKTLIEQGLPIGGGNIKVLKTGHLVITRAQGLSAETLIVDIRCIKHIESLTTSDLHDSNNHLCWCCCMPCCGKFPVLHDRVRLMADDEIDNSYCACCTKWGNIPCVGGQKWKQVISEFAVQPGRGAEFAQEIRKVQQMYKKKFPNIEVHDGRCFKVLELNDIQGRFVTKGKIIVCSPEGEVNLPDDAIQVKDAEELLMMNDGDLRKLITSRGMTLFPNRPLLPQAEEVLKSQMCDRYVVEEIPRSNCCKCNLCRKNCICINIRPFATCRLPLNGKRLESRYKIDKF